MTDCCIAFVFAESQLLRLCYVDIMDDPYFLLEFHISRRSHKLFERSTEHPGHGFEPLV